MTEIERKFLLNYLPEKAVSSSGTAIRQGYLWIGTDREARVRQYGKKYYFTLKDGKGLSREELEIQFSKKQFDELWPATAELRIEKERYKIPWHGKTVEIDLFHGLLEGLKLAEVEFETERDAADFVPPPWCGLEVTEDSLFTNRTLGSMSADEIRDKLGQILAPPERSIGAIPIIYLNDEPNYILVTTTGSKRWIFPKGSPEKEMKDKEVAKMEAFEEAGVEGDLFLEPIPVYYWKGYQCFEIIYYPMKVENLHMSWEESKQRSRKVCGLDEALNLLDETSIQFSLKVLSKNL